MTSSPQSLIEKIQSLPTDRISEVEDFVDFIATRAQSRSLAKAAAAASVPVFEKVWNNPDDDVYDGL